jgi:hypothetical protein
MKMMAIMRDLKVDDQGGQMLGSVSFSLDAIRAS